MARLKELWNKRCLKKIIVLKFFLEELVYFIGLGDYKSNSFFQEF